MAKKFTLILSAVTLCALIAVGGTLAYFTDSLRAANTVSMGTVELNLDISIDLAAGGQGLDPDQPYKLLPGQSTEQVIRLNNPNDPHNVPIYVRVQMDKRWEAAGAPGVAAPNAAESFITITDGYANGDPLPSEWFYSNGYYYYQDILPVNAYAVELPCVIAVSTLTDGAYSDLNGVVAVKAYAVQSDYFTPLRDVGGRIIGWDDAGNSLNF
ncbi:MAG: SipW-dependent-type signal peptide-containing protein [Gracilibacteraceae bacterium]|jgi:predicted ribosomally synthesized peptide with SipW-like signal peptide|nr:SipW-dependent-type signal peptide-containing protein [Gracilibacteraceae bacterium]